MRFETHKGGGETRQSKDALVEVEVAETRHGEGKVKEVLDELVPRREVLGLELPDLDLPVGLLLRSRLYPLGRSGADGDVAELVEPREERGEDPDCPEARGVLADPGEALLVEDLDLCAVGLKIHGTFRAWYISILGKDGGGIVLKPHPDKVVIEEIEGVAELADDGGDAEDRVVEGSSLDCRLEVLQWLSVSHNCGPAALQDRGKR